MRTCEISLLTVSVESVLVIENGPIDTGPAASVPYMATLLNTADMYSITSAPVAVFANQTFPVLGKITRFLTPVVVLSVEKSKFCPFSYEALQLG